MNRHTLDALRTGTHGFLSAPVLTAARIHLMAALLWAWPVKSQDFHFDSSMSRAVLENYLSRSISFTELLHDDLTKPRNSRGVDPRDNMRLILDTKAKFIGRALMVWGRERNLPAFLETAKPYAAALHKADPEIILQAAAFEIVTRGVESISIPEPVFREFHQPVTNRTFSYQDMLYADGRFVNHWGGNGSVPDMSRLETRMWFYFLVTSYIDVEIEAIHFGQVGLMDKNDPGHAGWLDLLKRVRAYARKSARRHFLVCDAHTPTGGYVEDGKLLFDFHSFPLRIAEVADQPHKGVLKVGYSDSIYTKSKGGLTPSGWACEHLPYLVEFDNFGRRNPGKPGSAPFIWGWDEITWFALLPEKERNDWLRYACKWVRDTDPNGHLQMPGSRLMTPGTPDGARWYWANTRSDACPDGFNTEETIRTIWAMGSKFFRFFGTNCSVGMSTCASSSSLPLSLSDGVTTGAKVAGLNKLSGTCRRNDRIQMTKHKRRIPETGGSLLLLRPGSVCCSSFVIRHLPFQ